MYRYAQVEDALLRVQGVPEGYRIGLRARLKNLGRLGVKKESDGKGGRIVYEFDDVCLWAFCLELAQFGIDPARIAMMSKWLWLVVSPALTEDPRGDDLVFAARPVFLSREALEHDEQSGKTGQGLFPIDPSDQHGRLVYDAATLSTITPSRSVLVNLSDLRRRIVDALATV